MSAYDDSDVSNTKLSVNLDCVQTPDTTVAMVMGPSTPKILALHVLCSSAVELRFQRYVSKIDGSKKPNEPRYIPPNERQNVPYAISN